MRLFGKSLDLPTPAQALPGRGTPMPLTDRHFVNGQPLKGPFAGNLQQAVFGLGCFWGAERRFWQMDGVVTTAVGYDALLRQFWESHDPTQGMRQGNDIGTQYRSAIYTFGVAQQAAAEASRDAYNQALADAGYGPITTEISPAGPFYYAEDYHQQYLAKNPGGYCGLGGTGVRCV